MQTCVVLRSLLTNIVAKVACKNSDHAAVLVRPVFNFIKDRVEAGSAASEIDIFKVLDSS